MSRTVSQVKAVTLWVEFGSAQSFVSLAQISGHSDQAHVLHACPHTMCVVCLFVYMGVFVQGCMFLNVCGWVGVRECWACFCGLSVCSHLCVLCGSAWPMHVCLCLYACKDEGVGVGVG